MAAIKAIAFVRVSSNQQDYNRQISDLMPLIKSDGYKDDEIAIIKHKESAIKNDINNRKSIAELKELIAKNQIESLYCTEVSRLARRGDVLYGVLALLEENEISLVTLTPTLLRTRENGKPNPIAHVVIAFLGQVAEQEMALKKERQKSGYAQKVKDGKVCSSRVIFGYMRNKDGYAQIDDANAKIVFDIFSMYNDGNSVYAIWDKYQHTGVFGKLGIKSGCNKIGNILRDTTYIGKNGSFNYPAIIDDALFYAVQHKMDSNQMIKSKLDNVYYCQGLLKYDGHTMTPEAYACTYVYKNPENGKNTGINMNAMDSLLWGLAVTAKAQMDSVADDERYNNIKEQLSLILSKLDGIKTEKDAVQKSLDRATNLYVSGKVTQDKYDAITEDYNGQYEHLMNEEEQLQITQVELEAVITKTDNGMQQVKDYNSLLDITDDKTRQSIIREAIESVTIDQCAKGEFRIYVDYVDKSLNNDTYYHYIQRGCKKHLYCCYGEFMEDWTNSIVNRIKRGGK